MLSAQNAVPPQLLGTHPADQDHPVDNRRYVSERILAVISTGTEKQRYEVRAVLDHVMVTGLTAAGCAVGPRFIPVSDAARRVEFQGFSILPPSGENWSSDSPEVLREMGRGGDVKTVARAEEYRA